MTTPILASILLLAHAATATQVADVPTVAAEVPAYHGSASGSAGPPASAPELQRPHTPPVLVARLAGALTLVAAVVLGLAGGAILLPVVAGLLALLVVVPAQALRDAWRRRDARPPAPPPGPMLPGRGARAQRMAGAQPKRRGAETGRRRRRPR